MIGNRQILATAGVCSRCHFFDAAGAVAPIGMIVKIAADVFEGHELRDPTLSCEFDLVESQPNFGRNELQAEKFIYLRLIATGRDQAVRIFNAILTDLEPSAQRELP